ncbi:MAG: macro domain-containing protein [Prevotella sp.]|nr:macro domain-containing protein [Alistipes senegalensis]MCM1358598.1 macro domain-containing protein [Prevotella sp.]MCM1473851.1 macro domain-containing protein [Muribaculaceae bacterium]
MTYHEEKRDLFSVSEEYYFVHCVSADFVLGKGIALEFKKRFDMKNKLRNSGQSGKCILIERVFNLVTKETWRRKPNMESVAECLYELKKQVTEKSIKKLAMPRIACGLDGMNWESVSEQVRGVFSDTDIEILVCYM